MVMLVIGVVVLLVVVAVVLWRKMVSLQRENKKLNEILAIKDTTISNYEASRVAVNDVIENFYLVDGVIDLIAKGKSRVEVAEALGLTLSRVELIIKLAKLKK